MEEKCPARVGDLLPTWFSGRENGLSNVLEVLPYFGRGNYKWTLRLSAENTSRGWMDMPYNGYPKPVKRKS